MSSKSLREKLKSKKADIKSKQGGFKYFVIKEGTIRVRHMAPGGEKDWSIEATTFYLGQELGLLISPATLGGKCAFMEGYKELSASKNSKDREVAKRIKPGRKFFSPVAKYKDLKGEEIDKEQGVKLLLMTPGLCQEAIDLYLDDTEAGDFTNYDEGYDLKYSREGTGKMDTKYFVRQCKPTRFKWTAAKQKEYDPEDMLKAIIPTYKETKVLLEKFLNLAPEDDDKDVPRKKKKKRDL